MGKIALVGMGLIGRAWAISFARAGHEVALWDARGEAVESALAFAGATLPDLEACGLLSDQTPGAVRARMRAAATLAEALAGAEHVQENTPEDVEVKRAVFARTRRGGAARRDAREFDLGDPAVAVHGRIARARPLPRRASDQSASSCPGGGNRARALDGGRDRRARRRIAARGRPRADRDEARN